MNRFIVERNLLVGHEDDRVSAETVTQESQQLATQASQIEWITTIVTDTKIYSIYEAPSAEHLRQIAHRSKYVIHRLLRVQSQR